MVYRCAVNGILMLQPVLLQAGFGMDAIHSGSLTLFGAIGGKPGEQAREFGRIERLADHPGRGDKHFFRRAAQMLCNLAHDLFDRLAAPVAGEGIAVSGVYHQRPGATTRDLFAASPSNTVLHACIGDSPSSAPTCLSSGLQSMCPHWM